METSIDAFISSRLTNEKRKRQRDAYIPSCSSSRSDSYTGGRVQYLLNRAVRSELVKRQGVAPPRYGAKGVRGCPPIYMHGKSSKNRMGNMNVISMG